jgi:zinc protease
MGYLTDAMTPEKVNGQRDVVKNERRQSYENRPYGMVSIVLDESLYPTGHPYSWPTIGSMKDLNAASYEDVVQFFKTFYIPNNASVAIAGDIDINQTIKLVEKWFDEIPAGSTVPKLTTTEAKLGKEKRIAFEDKVQLPRLYMAWLTPAVFASGDAELDIVASVLAGGKNSRLYKRLVYEMQIAQDVSAYQASQKLSSTFLIVATARSGHTLTEIETVIQEELNKIRSTPPEQQEVQRAINQYESSYLTRLENVSSKADLLNHYYFYAGEPDYFAKDLARYYKVTPEYVMATVKTFLKDDARVVLSVVPRGKKDLAAKGEFMSVEGK